MDSLTTLIAGSYALPPIKKWEEVRRGYINENYFISTDKERFFLRGYSTENIEKIERTYRIEDFFHGKGIPLPLPLSTTDGSRCVVHDQKIYSLFPFVEGMHPDPHTFKAHAPALKAFAQALAALHLAGRHEGSFTDNRLSTWNKDSFARNASLIEESISQKSKLDDFDRLALETLALKRELVEKHPQAFDDYGLACDHLIHGDYYLDNVLFRDDGSVASVLDWDGSAMGPRSVELARSTYFTFFFDQAPSEESIRAAAAYVSAYHEAYPISRDEALAGLRAQFAILIHSLWIEKTHYLKQSKRIDGLMAPRASALRYIAKDLDGILDMVTAGLA